MIADFAPNPLRLGDGCASCTRRPFSHWLLLYAPPRRPATNQRTRNTPACFPAAICTPVRRKDSIFTNFTFSGKIWRSSSSLALSHHGSPVCRSLGTRQVACLTCFWNQAFKVSYFSPKNGRSRKPMEIVIFEFSEISGSCTMIIPESDKSNNKCFHSS